MLFQRGGDSVLPATLYLVSKCWWLCQRRVQLLFDSFIHGLEGGRRQSVPHVQEDVWRPRKSISIHTEVDMDGEES